MTSFSFFSAGAHESFKAYLRHGDMKFIAVTILLFKAGSYDSFQAVKISDPQPQINGPII